MNDYEDDDFDFENADRGDELTEEQLRAGEEDEQDDEQEPEPEHEDENEDGSEETEPKKGQMIPKARFNEAVKREREKADARIDEERRARLALEEEVARLKGAAKSPEQKAEEPPKEYDFKAARAKARAAMMDGDEDAAEAIEEEIFRQQQLRAERIAEEKAAALYEKRAAEQRQQTEAQQVDAVVSEAYSKYPFLDIKAADADHEAIDEVVALRDLYASRGKSMPEAIRMAVEKVGPRYAQEDQPKPKAKPTEESIRRNIERDKKIPPKADGLGERARRVDPADLTDEEFERLSPEDLKRMRGDYVS